LAQGHRPLTQPDAKTDNTDIALKEISEGKLGYELLAEGAPGAEASSKD
jgi:DNA-directed RNA polymerase subunit K/omega